MNVLRWPCSVAPTAEPGEIKAILRTKEKPIATSGALESVVELPEVFQAAEEAFPRPQMNAHSASRFCVGGGFGKPVLLQLMH